MNKFGIHLPPSKGWIPGDIHILLSNHIATLIVHM